MPALTDPGIMSKSIVMDPHPSRHDLNNLFPLHELIAKCLLLSNSSWQAEEWPQADPWQISHAFCTFLQGCSRHRLSLSQISQDLTAAVRRLHYVPIWLMFALTCLLTPTSFPPPDNHPPTAIDSSDKTDGDFDKWTLRKRWFECIQMSAHPPVTTKRVSRRWHAGMAHRGAETLRGWLRHANAFWKNGRERFTDLQWLHHIAFVSRPLAKGREITPGCGAVNALKLNNCG